MTSLSRWIRAQQQRRVPAAVVVLAVLGLVAPLGGPGTPVSSEPVRTVAAAEVDIVGSTSSAGFTHPAVGMTAADLRNAREQVRAGVQPWAGWYAAMAASPLASRAWRGANVGPDDQPVTAAYAEVGMRRRASTDGMGAMTQALMYWFTGDEVYRANALHSLRAWGNMDPTRYAYFADAHIHTGVPLYQHLIAAELLRAIEPVNADHQGYGLVWTDDDTRRLTDNYVRPVVGTFLFSRDRYMNQHNFGMVGSIAAAIFTDDRQLYAERVEWSTVNAGYGGGAQFADANGALAAVFREIPADHPHNPHGEAFVQHQEMGRDQAHAGADVTNLAIIARMLRAQGTLVDPVAGTVSTAPDAVDLFSFRDDRLLDAANAFEEFMSGGDIRWVDVEGRGRTVSEAYRGRLHFGASALELYYQYRYVEGVDVAAEAPAVARNAARDLGPVWNRAGTLVNVWDTWADGGAEYWVSFPPQLAQEDVVVAPPAPDPSVPFAEWGLPLDARAAVVDEGGERAVRVTPSREGSVVALPRMFWPDRTRYAPVAVRLRTTGRAVLEVSRTATAPAHAVVPLPDTGGQWRSVTFDVASAVTPISDVGDNIAYFTVTGDPAVQVDLSGVDTAAARTLTPPVYTEPRDLGFVAVVGERFDHTFAATDPAGEPLTHRADGLPAGATVDASTGQLTWTPTAEQAGEHRVTAVVSDAVVDTTLAVTVTVAADRAAAVRAVLDGGFDPAATYTAASRLPLDEARAAVDAALPGPAPGFAVALEALRVAVRDLELLSPLLADGTLDYPALVTSAPTLDLTTLTDGRTDTHWSDLRVPSVTLDFGEHLVSVDGFGFRARDPFGNRSQGTNAYGSLDGDTWTLLTERTTANTLDREDIPVVAEHRADRYRFLHLRMDAPGVPTDPAYPGIWCLAELRIDGQRHERVDDIDEVSLTSPAAVGGRVQTGDAVTLEFSSARPITDVSVAVEGVAVPAASADGRSWTATTTLGDATPDGRPLRFSIDHRTADGQDAVPVHRSTDGTSLYASSTVGLLDLAAAPVVRLDGTPDPAGASGARLLVDRRLDTHTDVRPVDGQATLVWDLGEPVRFARADLIVRQDRYGLERRKDLRLEGSTDLVTWTPVSLPAAATSSWQRLDATAAAATPHRYLRLRNGAIMGVAELRVFGPPPARFEASVPDPGPSGWHRGPVEVTLEPAAGSGPGTAEYRLDGGAWVAHTGPVVVTGDGEHLLEYRVAGDQAPAGSVPVRIDTTAPTPALTSQGSRGTTTVTLTALDAGSGPGAVEYRLGPRGAWLPYDGPVEIRGRVDLAYRTVDVAGNAGGEWRMRGRPARLTDLAVEAAARCAPGGAEVEVVVTNTENVPVRVRVRSGTASVVVDDLPPGGRAERVLPAGPARELTIRAGTGPGASTDTTYTVPVAAVDCRG